MRTFGMPQTLLRNVAIASFACVVVLSACQPRQPQGAGTSGLTELSDEPVGEGTVTSEIVSTTEVVVPAAPESTTTEAATAVSSTAASPTSTATPTTTIAEPTITSSPADVVTTTSAPESTTTTVPVAVAPTTSVPMSSSYYSIDISGFSFAPSALTVQVGDTVTWTNLDSATHTVTFNGSPSISSGGLQEGGTHSVTFDSVGTYAYGCSPHAYMEGTITVTK
ncbi:MAG: cupredoxin domain-containing protein [Ilumatobacteraceae bacterium]